MPNATRICHVAKRVSVIKIWLYAKRKIVVRIWLIVLTKIVVKSNSLGRPGTGRPYFNLL